jgi:hypothetical protein
MTTKRKSPGWAGALYADAYITRDRLQPGGFRLEPSGASRRRGEAPGVWDIEQAACHRLFKTEQSCEIAHPVWINLL